MTTRVASELLHAEELGEMAGFVLGDGTTNSNVGTVRFSNANVQCVDDILSRFERVLDIPRDGFSYYLVVPHSSDINKIRETWRRRIGLNKKILASRDKNKKTKAIFGVMTVALYNRQATNQICNATQDALEMIDMSLAKGFVRGFFAAEGTVIPGKKRKLVPNAIQFPQKGTKLPDVISRILKKLGVESRVVVKQKKSDYYCANVTAYENFRKFYELGLADLHQEKKEKIRRGLASYKKKIGRRRSVAERLLTLLSRQTMTRKEIYQSMGKSPQHINGILYNKNRSFLLKNKYIRKLVGGGKIRWKATREGLQYLRALKKTTN
jgi:intein-encoded DNA endonuclease-like protein